MHGLCLFRFKTGSVLRSWFSGFLKTYKRGFILLIRPTSDMPMEEKRCAVVTGGNKGIGFEICRQLALEGIQVILTARDKSRGIEAVENLNDMGLQNVVFHQLEIRDETSIQHLVKFVETNFKKLDILVNNAGVIGIIMQHEKFRAGGGFMQVTDENVHLLNDIIEEPYDLGKDCLETNYYGTKRVTEALVPLLHLSKSPRIVNLSSRFGELHVFHNEKLKEELQDIEKLTEERIDEIIQWFLRDFKDAKLWESGWPLTASAYKVSKVALNAYTRLMARRFKNILVNCVCPGSVITDMSSHWGLITPEEGAKSPVMVALLPDDGPSGVYFHQMEISGF